MQLAALVKEYAPQSTLLQPTSMATSPSLKVYSSACLVSQRACAAQLAALVKEYAPQAYFNGHDHTSTHADPMRAGVPSVISLHCSAGLLVARCWLCASLCCSLLLAWLWHAVLWPALLTSITSSSIP